METLFDFIAFDKIQQCSVQVAQIHLKDPNRPELSNQIYVYNRKNDPNYRWLKEGEFILLLGTTKNEYANLDYTPVKMK